MSLITNSVRLAPVDQARRTATTLCDLADALDGCASLRPAAQVDTLFDRLVRTVVDTPEHVAAEVLTDPDLRARLPGLRDLSARGETELERTWATRVAASTDPTGELAEFPYLDNYRQLTRMEVGVLSAALWPPARSAAVIGSGPLPLSAWLLADTLNVPVDGIDHDPDAVDRASRMAKRAGLMGVRSLLGDARHVDLAGYDVVVLAALVGSTPAEKAAILSRLRSDLPPGALLLVRSARGLRTALYPPVETVALAGFEVLATVHPVNDIVNSVVLARVPAASRGA